MKRYHKVVDVYVTAETEDQADERLAELLIAGFNADPDDFVEVNTSEPWDDDPEPVEGDE